MLEANPDYWGGKIDVDRSIIRPIPETAPRVAALLKGEVDIITQLPPDQGERVTGNATTRVAGALYAGLYVLAVNSKVPPLDNPLVKQALSLAIDREAIVKELWRGRGIVPSGPIAKGDNHFDASLPPLGLRPEGGARAAEEGRLQGRGDHHRDDGRLHRQRQADVRGDRGHVEGRRHQRQGRGRRVLGARPEEPRQVASRGCGGRIPPPPSAIPTA